jgi:hypothetical protein
MALSISIKCQYAEYRCAECFVSYNDTLNVTMLSVVMLSVVVPLKRLARVQHSSLLRTHWM